MSGFEKRERWRERPEVGLCARLASLVYPYSMGQFNPAELAVLVSIMKRDIGWPRHCDDRRGGR